VTIGARPPVLALYPAAYRPLGAVEPLGNAGGFSGSKLWRFASPRGDLVLRAWPIDGPGADLYRIHTWIIQAASLPFVPAPIAAADGRTVQEAGGRVWDLSPWMPGVADLDRPPTSHRIRSAFAGLARFHAQFGQGRRATSPGLATRLTDVWRWIGGDFDAVRARLQPVGADPRSDLTRLWIDRASRKARGLADLLYAEGHSLVPIQPCLRDTRPDHFLFEGDRLTGLIDFGAMGMDTVAGDLARLLGESIGTNPTARDEALSAYRSIRPLRDEEAGLIATFEKANAILGAGRWARWHFLECRAFQDPDAVVLGLRRGLGRLDEAR
jgi:Ser/Thr protein kinase RdoA (MazF antagonist)